MRIAKKILRYPIFENNIIESLQLFSILIQPPFEYWLALMAYLNET